MPAKNRIESLDALRGLALLGILLINIQVFSGYGFLGIEGREALPGAGNDATIKAFLDIGVADKFYSLFSLLFGYSFVMLAQRAEAPVGLHLRRMLGLVVIGLAHSLLLWPWDILLLYGLVGLLLTPFLRARATTLAVTALGVLIAVGLMRWLWAANGLPLGRGELATTLLQTHTPAFRDGSWIEVVRANAHLTVGTAVERLEGLRPLRVLALFLLGAVAARLRLAEPGSGHRALLAAGIVVALPAGLALAWLETQLAPDGGDGLPLYLLAETLAPPLTALGYATLLLACWRSGAFIATATRRLFSPVGRMALTQYLLQSAVCVPLFYGFGSGRFAEDSLAHLCGIALLLFSAQVAVSLLWLRFFRQGPMEWLWRWQIQGARPPLLQAATH